MMLRLHDSSNRGSRTRRAGFSLIELLVSISIFVILATLALSAFRDSKHDKMASASRQISAAIGGARSRAAKSAEPRGIRLLRDKQDPSLISGLQYVGESQLFNGTLRVQIDSAGVVQLKTVQLGDWATIRNEGMLKPGNRIYIRTYSPDDTNPSDSISTAGRWYTIATQGFDPDNHKMQIVGAIDGAQWNPTALGTGPGGGGGAYQFYPYLSNTVGGGEPAFSNTLPIPYLLRLAPQELPETEPINLPPGAVVDLESSRIPTSWENFEDLNQNGILDGTEDSNINGNPLRSGRNNGILDDVQFDIPVSPNGTVTGPLNGSGPIYLYLCARDDVDRMRAMRSNSSGGVFAATRIPGDFENGYGPDHPSSERRLICIIPQTGLVYVSAVNGYDREADPTSSFYNVSVPGYGYADDPYSLARQGREDR